MNIIVLTGGFSTERDVSFAMGGQIANALMQNGHKVVLLDTYGNIEKHNSFDALYKEHHKANYDFVVPENEPNLKLLKRLRGGNDLLGANILEACKTADICFIAQAGGVAENGQLSAIFDAFNIAYTGSGYIGSMLSIDKSIAKNIMKANGILTPNGETVGKQISSKEIERKLKSFQTPYIVKACNGGSSIGIQIVKNDADTSQAQNLIKNYNDDFVIEEFIKGRNFTVGVLGDNPLPSCEIMHNNEFNDFKTKYQGLSQKICPSQISQDLERKLQRLSLQVHNTLKMESYSRQDFIVDDKENAYCLEANSRAGMTRTSIFPKEAKAIGIEFNDLCEIIIKHGLDRQKAKSMSL